MHLSDIGEHKGSEYSSHNSKLCLFSLQYFYPKLTEKQTKKLSFENDRFCIVFGSFFAFIYSRVNHLRHIRFYGKYLFRKSANSIFQILIDCLFLINDFENWF